MSWSPASTGRSKSCPREVGGWNTQTLELEGRPTRRVRRSPSRVMPSPAPVLGTPISPAASRSCRPPGADAAELRQLLESLLIPPACWSFAAHLDAVSPNGAAIP
jgi:hypothetical protein